jgi:hypothetical protein
MEQSPANAMQRAQSVMMEFATCDGRDLQWTRPVMDDCRTPNGFRRVEAA